MTKKLTGCLVLMVLVACADQHTVESETPLAATATLQNAAETPASTTAPPAACQYQPGQIILEYAGSLEPGAGGLELGFCAPAWQVIRVDTGTPDSQLIYRFSITDKFHNVLSTFEAGGAAGPGSIAELNLPYAGIYDVLVELIQGNGEVTLAVTALDAPGSSLHSAELPLDVQAAFTVRRASHTHSLMMTRGQWFFLGLTTTRGLQVDARLYDPAGAEVTLKPAVTAFGGQVLAAEAPLEGQYVIVIANENETTGEYQLHVASAAKIPPPADIQFVVYNQDYRATFTQSDTIDIAFSGQLGDVLQLSVRDMSSGLGVVFHLVGSSGGVLAWADSKAGQSASVDEIQLPYTGTFYIRLYPRGSGQAVLRIDELGRQNLTGGGQFGINSHAAGSGRFDGANAYHLYQFTGAATNAVYLKITPVTSRIIMALYSPSGQYTGFWQMRDSGEGANTIYYELAETGTFTLIVYTADDYAGVYELEFTREE
nr:hypothetical protein [Anaerolineae bacterium]